MATIDDLLLAAAAEETDDKTLVIDNDLRTITIPPSIKSLGVESDADVLRLQFRMPSTYGNIDLSTFAIRINYMNANGDGDVYPVTDAAVADGYITFSWLVGRSAAAYKGNVHFIACLKNMDLSSVITEEFNTTVATLPVLEGLETTEKVVQQNPDVLENILARLGRLEAGGTGTGGACNIPRIETAVNGQPKINLRDLESGTYIIYGCFEPYPNSNISMSADNSMVSVVKKDAGTHAICLDPLNAKIVFFEILVDDTTEKGYTFTRTIIPLLDVYNVLGNGGGACNVPRYESAEETEAGIRNLRELDSGTYILDGYWNAYPGADTYMPFDNRLVTVEKQTEGSHLFVFQTLNAQVIFHEILVDAAAADGFTHTRTEIDLLDMHNTVQSLADSGQNPDVTVSGIYAGATEPTDGSLVWIDTTEEQEETVLDLDPERWLMGYFAGAGGGFDGGSATNNEALYMDVIRVEPGKTYTMYSTDPEWTSGWIGISLYAYDTDTSGFIKRIVNQNVSSVTITIPDNVRYILISSRNLANDDNYLNIRLVEGSTIPDEPDEPVVPDEPEKTLTNITATYSGGEVAVGTAVSSLTGIVVTAHYSDGTSEPVTGYTLSGTIAEGSNIITVSYGDKTTTFAVTGVSESGGENTTTWTAGHVGTTGGVDTNSYTNGQGGMCSAEYIPVNAGDVFYIYSTESEWSLNPPSGVMFTFIGYYDADKNFIKRANGAVCANDKWASFTVPDNGAAYIRLSCSNISGNESVVRIGTEADLPQPECTFEDAIWVAGYVGSNGALGSDASQGEMRTGLISVDEGATYTFANSDPDWSATWIGVGFYPNTSLDGATRKTGSGKTITFTVTEGMKYVALSARNLTDYYTTATLTKDS